MPTLSWLISRCRHFSVRDINLLVIVSETPPGCLGLTALVVILIIAHRSTPRFPGLQINLLPDVIRTIIRDTVVYFGIVFTSQFILTFQASARVIYQPGRSSGFGPHRRNCRMV